MKKFINLSNFSPNRTLVINPSGFFFNFEKTTQRKWPLIPHYPRVYLKKKIMKATTLQRMIEYFGTDTIRINHALKVYGFASCIAQREKLTHNEIFIVEMAAILHDIGIKAAEQKHHSSKGHYQEIEGPPIAKKILAEFQLETETLDRICHIIGNHHSYLKIDGLDFQIVVEADFLVNIYEDEIAQPAIESIKKKYFKTKTGISILESMYQNPSSLT